MKIICRFLAFPAVFMEDALPPLEAPFDLVGGRENHSFFMRVAGMRGQRGARIPCEADPGGDSKLRNAQRPVTIQGTRNRSQRVGLLIDRYI